MLDKKTKKYISDNITDEILYDKNKRKAFEDKYHFKIKEVTDYSVGLRKCFVFKDIKEGG